MNIAILSRNTKLYSTRRLKQAGEARGHKVEIIDHLKCVLFIEKKNPVFCIRAEGSIILMPLSLVLVLR